uniref:Natural resistance-associated macrophage protein isotype II n=1 Tax=Perkinsus marinus TaxID=31276 RepID=D5FGJ1_9ALVE|nr:natural resistance-associated macrophage protein isotype II [Perkinsus marinus]
MSIVATDGDDVPAPARLPPPPEDVTTSSSSDSSSCSFSTGSAVNVAGAEDNTEASQSPRESQKDDEPGPLIRDGHQIDIPIDPPGVKFSIRTFFKYAGPGWLMSLAYLDPGNLEADLQAGAFTGFQLLWVLLLAHIAGLLLQICACRIGAATGESLAENCRRGYSRRVSNILWIMSEIAIIGSDIQEVIGTATAFHVLFGIDMWVGVLITAADTLTFLFIQIFHGMRVMEAFIFILIMTMMGCFFANMAITAPPAVEVAKGFIPNVSSYAVMELVGIVGAVIMPHNLYLHSALVQSRKIDKNNHEFVKQANMYLTVDACCSILISFIINMAVVCSFAYGMFSLHCARMPKGPFACLSSPDDWSTSTCDPLNPDCHCTTSYGETGVCAMVGLENAAEALGAVISSDAMKYIFAVGVLAAGQASTLTGTMAGQYVMEGFMHIRISMWVRVLLTRTIALGPALAIALVESEVSGMNGINAWLNILQSIQLPFALLPLLHYAMSKKVMGTFALNRWWSAGLWLLALIILAINVYLIITTLVPLDWPWYAWAIIGVVFYLYVSLCFYCVEDDLSRGCSNVKHDITFFLKPVIRGFKMLYGQCKRAFDKCIGRKDDDEVEDCEDTTSSSVDTPRCVVADVPSPSSSAIVEEGFKH